MAAGRAAAVPAAGPRGQHSAELRQEWVHFQVRRLLSWA